MASIVPGLEGQGRSEGHVLNVSVQFILEQIQERRRLVEQVEARGGVVSDELKAYVTPKVACFCPPSFLSHAPRDVRRRIPDPCTAARSMWI